MYIRILSVLIVFAMIAVSCDPSQNQELDRPVYELTWSDEFNAAAGTSVDTTNWNFDIGRGISGWGNQELQYYTDRVTNVVQDGNGNLVITALSESFSGASYTSARINTKDKFEQAYGRIEASIITPYGPGIWPAFWMLGSDIDEVGWPQTGEIDIMELRGQLPNVIAGSLHGPGYSAGNAITQSYALEDGRFDSDYFLYAVEWTPNKVDFFVNDFLYNRITRSDVEETGGEWVFDKPFYILLNVAIGGNYVGPPSPDTPFPQQMVVDYVRVYREAD